MAKSKEEVYNSLFDYIFSTKKPKGGGVAIEGVNVSGLSGIGKGLAEIAAYPSVYPAEKLMSDFNFQVDLATRTEVKPTRNMKLELGAGSIVNIFANPKGWIDKAWADYQQAEKDASFSGRVKILDGAKFFLVGKKYGLEFGDAWNLGSAAVDATGTSYTDVFKTQKTRGKSIDYTSRKDKVSGTGAGYGAGRLSEGTFAVVDRGLSSEFDAAIRYFELSNGVSLSDAEKASMKNSFKHYFRQTSAYTSKAQRRSEFRRKLDNFSFNVGGTSFSLNDRIKKSMVDGICGIEETLHGSYAEGSREWRLQNYERDDNGYFDFKEFETEDKDDPTARIRFASTRSVIKNLNSIIETTSDPTLKSKLTGLRNVFIDYVSGRKVRLAFSLGSMVGQTVYIKKWVKDELKGKFLGSFLTGGLFDYKNDIFKSGFADKFLKGGGYYNQLVDPRTGAIDSYKFGAKWVVGNDTALGKFADAYYYWHPVNFAKGLFWDGRTWKKFYDLGLIKNVDTVRRIMKFMPSQVLWTHWKPFFEKKIMENLVRGVSYPFKAAFSKFAQKFVKDFASKSLKDIMAIPFRELVRQVAQKVILQIVGSTIPVIGNVAAFIADIAVTIAWNLGEKLLKPLLEFMLLIVLGVISIFLLGITGLGVLGRETLTQPYLSEPVDTTSGHLVYGPIDFDFPSVTDGDINCNQTLPDQNVSGVISKTEFGKLADRWTQKGGKNYADECYNDVVCRALSAGVDPAFALAVWLHESGASNYEISPGNIEDFGIHFTSPEDFNAQITSFMGLSFKCQCPSISDYAVCWASNYLTGGCDEEKGEDYLKSFMVAYNAVTSSPFPTKIKDPSRATGQLCVGVGGSKYPEYTGESLEYSGSVLSGSAKQIWDQVIKEFGVNSKLILIGTDTSLGAYLESQGAWCISQSGTISCLSNKINGASASMLTGLFRHEVAHHVQQSNGSLKNWPSNIREWGAEHLSGNGGHYVFYTSSGQCMRGLQVSYNLLESGKCTESELDQIARGLKPAGSCSSYISSYITGAKIGRCN